jgi:hypothetical protein
LPFTTSAARATTADPTIPDIILGPTFERTGTADRTGAATLATGVGTIVATGAHDVGVKKAGR